MPGSRIPLSKKVEIGNWWRGDHLVWLPPVAATQNRQTNGGTVVNSRQATSGGVELVWNCGPLLGGSVTMPRAPLAAIGAICCQTHGIRSNATLHPLLLLLHSYKDKSTHTMCAVSFDNAECCFVSTSAIGNLLQSTEY